MITKVHKENFYNFYQHGVTQSLIDMWLRCPHQARLYVHGWKPTGAESQAMVFGNICHHVLEQAYSGITCPLPGVVKCYIKEYEEILNLEDRNDLSSEEFYDYEVSLAKAEGVMLGYFSNYQKDFANNWEIAETIFKVPFEFQDGKKTYVTGKLDGGFTTEKESGEELYLMDHKCMGRINLQNLLILLPVDIQVNVYLWAVTQLTGRCPKGFKYNIIRNPSNKPLKSKDETLKEYSDRIQEDVENRPTHYFSRINIPVHPKEIDKWERTWLTPIMRDMRLWFDSQYKWPEYYRPNNLKTEYGTLSPWASALAENDFSKYEKRTKVFEEL